MFLLKKRKLDDSIDYSQDILGSCSMQLQLSQARILHVWVSPRLSRTQLLVSVCEWLDVHPAPRQSLEMLASVKAATGLFWDVCREHSGMGGEQPRIL